MDTNAPPARDGTLPAPLIVVDLDGTLTPTDTLAESVLLAVKRRPATLLRLPFWLLQGRAAFKARVAALAAQPGGAWPYRTELLDWLRARRDAGQRIVLATAAHHSIAQAVADHLGIFDAVLATRDGINLKGEAKLEAIRARFGSDFIYAGDSRADLAVWRGARGAIVVGKALGETVRALGVEVVAAFDAPRAGLLGWARALRIHQWVKNALIFVPVLTAFAFADVRAVASALGAFIAFSLAASATYVVNDLWDLASDRQHPRKRARPFAAARIPVATGLVAAGGLMAAALLGARLLPTAFLALLLTYVALTSAYSWILKEYVLIDALMLAVLYTLRIIAGGAATGITVSVWLLAFSVFIFLSLALIKRCAELVALREAGGAAARGRDYRVGDLTVLWPMGMGAGLCAVVVFSLFANAPEVANRYASPPLLWLVAIGLIYWLGRLWIKTARGEMDDDPVVYALRDRGSRVAVLLMLAAVLAARYLHLGA